MKKVLNRLGYYRPQPQVGITGEGNAALFESLKEFQRDHRLPVTGRAVPNDETIRRLNAENDKPKTGYYIWHTVEDEKVRVSHAALNGTLRDWADSPNPGEDYNCRCWADRLGNTILSSMDDEDIIAFIQEHEGLKNHMYLDSKGNVTIGMGENLSSKKMLENTKFIIRDPVKGTLRPATLQEVDEIYERIKTMPVGHVADWYKFSTDPIISNGEAARLARAHLRQDIQSLKNKFPDFQKYPTSAQKALLDMEYNLGPQKFNKTNWKNLFSVVKAKDWQTAARESHRKGISENRNIAIQQLFRQAGRD